MAEIQHLQDIAWQVIGSATVDGSKRECYWRAWKTHCSLHRDHPGTILPPHIPSDQLLTFAVAVPEGLYSKECQVQVQTVKKAHQLVSQKLVLDGHPDP
jgi:hypothetical protein